MDVHSGTSTIAWHPDSMAAQAIGICTSTSVVTATASGSTSRSMRSWSVKPGTRRPWSRSTVSATPATRFARRSQTAASSYSAYASALPTTLPRPRGPSPITASRIGRSTGGPSAGDR